MRIAVVGAGGLGAYFGGRWAQAGLDVTFLARGAQLTALGNAPLTIASPLGDATVRVAVVGDPARIGPVDVVMVATKTWQLPSAAERIGPLLGPDTMVFGVQNGVEAGDALAAAAGAERVLDGTCRIISYVSAPGSVVHVGVQPTLTFGERAGGVSKRAERLLGTLDRGAGMTVHLSAEIVVDLWKKFFFFAPVSALGALVQVPVGEWRELPETRELFADGMREVQALAAARGAQAAGGRRRERPGVPRPPAAGWNQFAATGHPRRSPHGARGARRRRRPARSRSAARHADPRDALLPAPPPGAASPRAGALPGD